MADQLLDQQGQRLKEFRQYIGLNQGEFADSLEIAQAHLSMIESGRKSISSNLLEKLALSYNVDFNWLLTGEGSIQRKPSATFVHSTPNFDQNEADLVHLTRTTRKNNVLVPVAAQAGYMNEWTQEYISQELEFIRVPGVDYEARTFEVSGDSMEPILHSGDYVVCSKVEKLEEIKSGGIYCVISSLSGISVKFCSYRQDSLSLRPANRGYASTTITPEEIHEIWKAELLITRTFTSPPQNPDDINQIKEFLSKNFPDFPGK